MNSRQATDAFKDRVFTIVIWGSAAVGAAVFGWILVDILWRGASELTWSFLTQPPSDAGRGGGIAPILVSTILILGVALVFAVPLALASAVALAEQSRKKFRLAWFIRRSLDVLAAVPSIVFGLFGNAFFCVALGMGYSILAGGLTLACMILPILIRTTEQGIRSVPSEYHFAAASLGLSRKTTLFQITLPAAMPALAAGLVLGVGRAVAETAALIFTSGYVTRYPGSLLDSGRSMSIHVFEMAMNVPGGDSRANATAALLVMVLLMINIAAMALMRLTGNSTPHSNARQLG